MRILNTFAFEKLKIHPVDISHMNSLKPERIDPDDITVNENQIDLIPGCFVRTVGIVPGHLLSDDLNVWIYFDHANMERLFITYRLHKFDRGAIVRYCAETYSKLYYEPMDFYVDDFPRHINRIFEFRDVTDVYISNLDLGMFTSEKDIVRFYINGGIDFYINQFDN